MEAASLDSNEACPWHLHHHPLHKPCHASPLPPAPRDEIHHHFCHGAPRMLPNEPPSPACSCSSFACLGPLASSCTSHPQRISSHTPKTRPFASHAACCKHIFHSPYTSAKCDAKDGASPAYRMITNSDTPQKKIILHHWYLIWCAACGTSEVGVGGYLTEELLDKDKRETAPIAERIKKNRLITKDGYDVTLAGLIDTDATCLNGFPFQISFYFMTGFPYIWNHLLNDWTNKLKESNCIDPVRYRLDADTQVVAEHEIIPQKSLPEDLKQPKNNMSKESPSSLESNPEANAEYGTDLLAADEIAVEKEEDTKHEQNVNTEGGLMGVLENQLHTECPLSCSKSQSPFRNNNICPTRERGEQPSNLLCKEVSTQQPSMSIGYAEEVGFEPITLTKNLEEADSKPHVTTRLQKAREGRRQSTYTYRISLQRKRKRNSLSIENEGIRELSTSNGCHEKENAPETIITSEAVMDAIAKESQVAEEKLANMSMVKAGSCLATEKEAGNQQEAQKEVPAISKSSCTKGSQAKPKRNMPSERREQRSNLLRKEVSTLRPFMGIGDAEEVGLEPIALTKNLVEADSKPHVTTRLQKGRKGRRQSTYTYRISLQRKRKRSSLSIEKEGVSKLSTSNGRHEDENAPETVITSEAVMDANAKESQVAEKKLAHMSMVTAASCLATEKEAGNQQDAEKELPAISKSQSKKRSHVKRKTNIPSVTTSSCVATEKEAGNQLDAEKELPALSKSQSKKISHAKQKTNIPSILPPPLPTPRVRISNRLVSEAFGLKTSKSGRLLVPPLAFWQNQTLAHDMDGGIIAIINGSVESAKTDTGRFNFRSPIKIEAVNLQKRLCAAATEILPRKNLSSRKKGT